MYSMISGRRPVLRLLAGLALSLGIQSPAWAFWVCHWDRPPPGWFETHEYPEAIAEDPSGNLVVAGGMSFGSGLPKILGFWRISGDGSCQRLGWWNRYDPEEGVYLGRAMSVEIPPGGNLFLGGHSEARDELYLAEFVPDGFSLLRDMRVRVESNPAVESLDGGYVVPFPDGSVVIGGTAFLSGNGGIYLRKLDSDWNTVWEVFDFEPDTYYWVDSVRARPDGGVVVGGNYDGPLAENLVACVAGYTADGVRDFLHVFTDAGTGIGNSAYDAGFTADGQYYAVGYSELQPGSFASSLAKVTPGSEILWKRRAEPDWDADSPFSWGVAGVPTSDGGVLTLTQLWRSWLGGEFQADLEKFDTDGESVYGSWAIVFWSGPGPFQQEYWIFPSDVIETSDGAGFVAVGSDNKLGEDWYPRLTLYSESYNEFASP